MLRWLKSLSIFGEGVSTIQLVGQVVWLLLVGGSAGVTSWLAKNTPFIAQFGPLAWIAAGLVVGLVVAAIIAIMQWANSQVRYQEYLTVLSRAPNSINPLADFFENVVIRVEDLFLPGVLLHEHKRFKNCKFVGPGALVIIGGTLNGIYAHDCGDVMVVPTAFVTGLVVLRNCTLTDCEFYRVTLQADPVTGEGFRKVGAKVVGLPNDHTQGSPTGGQAEPIHQGTGG